MYSIGNYIQYLINYKGKESEKEQIYVYIYINYESECVSHTVMSHSVTPRTRAHQAPLSMEIYRQEYWSGLPFPSPGHRPDPGIRSGSPALQARSSQSGNQGSPTYLYVYGPRLCLLRSLPEKTTVLNLVSGISRKVFTLWLRMHY